MLYLLGTGAFYFVGGIEGRQRKVELVCEGCSRGGRFCGVDGEGDATFLWLTLPTDRKKTEHGMEADWASCSEMSDRYRIFL